MRSVLARRILVTAALVGACALCFGRLTIHPGDTLVGPQNGGANDLVEYFHPMHVVQHESLRRHGQWPTWDDHLQLGRPLAGNPQTAFFYPANWIYFVWPSASLAGWVMVLHHLLGGWGTYLLCRRYESSPSAAVVGAVTYLAAPCLVAHTAEGHYPMACVAGWIPWALLSYERLRRGKKYSLPLTALVLALAFFASSAQLVFYLVAVLSAFWVVDLIRHAPQVLPRRELALRWMGVGALVVGLVAVELGPIWLTSQHTVRGRGAFSAAGAGGADWANLQQLLCPLALGGPAEFSSENGFYWDTLMSFGAVPLLLAIAGAACAWHVYPTPRYAVLALFSIVFALGATTPFYTLLHNFAPGVAKFQEPARIMFMASASVAVLAAVGVDRMARWLAATQTAARLAPALSIAATVVICAELAAYGIAVTRTIPPHGWRRENPLAATLADSSEASRVFIDQQLLSDREAWRYDVAKARGYDPFRFVRFQLMLQAATGDPVRTDNAELTGFLTDPALRYAPGAIDALGVKYIAVPHHQPVSDSPWRLVERGWMPARLRLRGSPSDPPQPIPYSLYENPDALPRAFVLGHTKKIHIGERAATSALTHLDPRETLLVETEKLTGESRQTFHPAPIIERSPTHKVIDAELDAPGYLVVSEMHAPGWQASVNGILAPIAPVNIGFRGVPLAPGKHRVEFDFRPPLRNVGLMITAMSLVVAGLLLWQDFRPDPTPSVPDDGNRDDTDKVGGRAHG